EDIMSVERDRDVKDGTEPGLQPGLAGKFHVQILNRHVAHIKCLADRQEGDDQKPIGLPCGGEEERAHIYRLNHAMVRVNAIIPSAIGFAGHALNPAPEVLQWRLEPVLPSCSLPAKARACVRRGRRCCIRSPGARSWRMCLAAPPKPASTRRPW